MAKSKPTGKSSSLKDVDKGYRSLMRRLGNQKNAGVQVGVFGDGSDKTYEDGITVGYLAEIHEYGLGNNPERSWLRAYVDANRDRIHEMLRVVAQEHLKKKMPLEQGLNLVGLKIVGEIQQRIADGIAPPLTEATIRRKGSTTPLIDTGQFRSSISHLAMLDMVLRF